MTNLKTYIKLALAFVTGPAFRYLFGLAVTAVAGWAAQRGYHISVPVIPTSFGLFALVGLARHVLANLGRAWHSGRLLAEGEAIARQSGAQILKDLIAAAEGKDAAPVADAKSNAYF